MFWVMKEAVKEERVMLIAWGEEIVKDVNVVIEGGDHERVTVDKPHLGRH